MPLAIRILRPSIYLNDSASPTSMFRSPSMCRRSDDSTSFGRLHLHRLLETVLTQQPTAAPIIEQLLTRLRDAA